MFIQSCYQQWVLKWKTVKVQEQWNKDDFILSYLSLNLHVSLCSISSYESVIKQKLMSLFTFIFFQDSIYRYIMPTSKLSFYNILLLNKGQLKLVPATSLFWSTSSMTETFPNLLHVSRTLLPPPTIIVFMHLYLCT